MTITTTTISISLEKATLKEIDEKRGDVPRSKFIQRVLEKVE